MRRATIHALVARLSSRLRFPRLFLLTALVFIADLFFPDMVPFIDEILLGLGTGLLGSWRRGRAEQELAHRSTQPGDPAESDSHPRECRLTCAHLQPLRVKALAHRLEADT